MRQNKKKEKAKKTYRSFKHGHCAASHSESMGRFNAYLEIQTATVSRGEGTTIAQAYDALDKRCDALIAEIKVIQGECRRIAKGGEPLEVEPPPPHPKPEIDPFEL